MTCLVVAIVSVMFLGGVRQEAVADPITFYFTGNVIAVDLPLAGTFNTAQILTGSYTFDPSTMADLNLADPDHGIYEPLTALEFTIGGYTGTLGGPVLGANSIRVSNDDLLGPIFGDVYFVNKRFPSGPSVAGMAPDQFVVGLVDSGASIFDSDALPLTPPDLSSFDIRRWQLEFLDAAGGKLRVAGQITSLEAVPEPGTLFLLGSGLLGLARYGRKKFRRSPSA
jgi:hypothetical protein